MSTGSGKLPGGRSTKKRRVHLGVAALVATVGAWQGAASADVVDIQLPDVYHAQVTNFFCAAASTEMALDTPAVTGANAPVLGLVTAGDGNFYQANTGYPLAGIEYNNGFGTVTAGSAQAFIYGLNHGLNTVNGIGYYNPYTPPGVGTDSQGIDFDVNELDNPNVNGPTFPFGSHQYAGYSLLNQGLATRTIANAISDTSVPAVVAVNNGGHAISVYGVNTTGAIGAGQNYVVNGVYVHDPWTGWAVAEQNGGHFNPALVNNNGGLGLGYNTYLRYGFDNNPANGPVTQLPNGNEVAVNQLAPWTRIFNVAGPQVTPNLQFYNYGYKFEVEPQGPELPDTGDPNNDYGLPAAPAELGTDLTTGSAADGYALSDLNADSTLKSDVELAGGSFDVGDAELMGTPTDLTGEGDWLIPYDGSGGVNDVTGAVMIDADTGVIDEATWIDPTNSEEIPYTLTQIDELFQDEQAGDLPEDQVLPEPTAVALTLVVGSLGLLKRRRSAAGNV